jgi:hypothetical protein
MPSFSEEFDKRLRRVCGVTDDSRAVSYESEFEKSSFQGCDTCGYGGDNDRTYVTVTVEGPAPANSWSGRIYKEFGDLGELMRALDAVVL